MTEPILVSFYQDTDGSGTYYKDCADRLKAQAKELGQDHSVLKRNYGKDYLSVTKGKPKFMLEMLKKHEGRDVIFVDVDTELLRKLDFTYDSFAWAAKPNGQPYGHVHYLPNNAETVELLEKWLQVLEDWEGGDHSALWLVIKRDKVKWTPIANIGTRLRLEISQTDASNAARKKLDEQNWIQTIQKRLSEV